jgi:hypothetical protein
MRIVAVLFCLYTLPASATNVDLSVVVLDGTGSPQQDCDAVRRNGTTVTCDKFVPMTIGRLMAIALDRGESLKPSDIVIRGLLATAIRETMAGGAKQMEIDPRDIDAVKEQLPKMGLTNSQIVQVYKALGISLK